MKNRSKQKIFSLVAVAALVLLMSLFITPVSYAATLHTNLPHSGGGDCPVYDYGSSGDANIANNASPQMFSFDGSNGPQLGAYFDPCSDQMVLKWSNANADWYQVITSANNQSNQGSYSNIPYEAYDGLLVLNIANVPYNTQYTYQVQSCNHSWLVFSSCSSWSPHVGVYSSPEGICVQGYVWRGANAADHVCVTSAQRNQVAYDNSQAPYRVNPTGPYGPNTCVQGYVWRGAFTNDFVCVTSAERSQVAYDNSQAASRIV
jgi:hypothetical protein